MAVHRRRAMVRDRVFIASIVAVIVAMVEADQKESTRMVYDDTTDPGSLVKSSRKVDSAAVAEGWSAGAACSAISDESACAMRSGCAWCLRNSTLKPPAGTRSLRIVSNKWGGIQGERRGGGGMRMLLQEGDESAEEHVRSCSAWNECTGPESLCELIISESACMGNIVQTGSSCVWCKSEGRCLSTTDSSGKELTGSSSAQCRGCDGVFDSTSSLDPCGVCGGTNSTCTPTAYRLSFTRHEKIGITLALVGNVLISVSLNTQKYAHNKNEERGAHKLSYLKLKLWWVGMVLMAIGETGNFLAYAYAPATVVAPLGAASVVSNCFLASFILKEHIGIRNILGVALAILGSVIIVLYAPASDRQLTMDVLVHYMTEWSFVVMVSLIVLVILVLFSLKDSIKKRYVVVYTLICSLTGALTVMCIKGVSTALVLTLQGQNQFYNVLPWVLVATVIGTLMIQLKYLNLAMMHFGASEVVPVYYVLFTFCSIMAGVLLYKEYHQRCPGDNPDCHYTLFFGGGCCVTFLGVHLINTDRKNDLNKSKNLTLATCHYRDDLDDDAQAVMDGVEIETEGLLGGEIKIRAGKGNGSPACSSPSGMVEMGTLSLASSRNHSI